MLLCLTVACRGEERRPVDGADSPSAAMPMVTDSVGQPATDSVATAPRRDIARDTSRTRADTAATTPAPTLDDAQIAAVVVNANAIDSAAGEVAKAKGSTKAVRDFAETVATEHGGVNRQAVTLAKRLSIKPQDSEVVRQLKADADQSRQALEGLSGHAFDSAYIGHEVAFHQTVLAAFDRSLIPGAQDPELKRLVEQSRPVVEAHLSRARALRKAMGTKG